MNPLQRRNIVFLLLYDEYGKTQQEIADFFNVSQGTVSFGIKEARYLRTISENVKMIQSLREELFRRMGPPQIDSFPQGQL